MAERRSPHGERGLKSLAVQQRPVVQLSLPSRGAWIEITVTTVVDGDTVVAPLTGSVD